MTLLSRDQQAFALQVHNDLRLHGLVAPFGLPKIGGVGAKGHQINLLLLFERLVVAPPPATAAGQVRQAALPLGLVEDVKKDLLKALAHVVIQAGVNDALVDLLPQAGHDGAEVGLDKAVPEAEAAVHDAVDGFAAGLLPHGLLPV